MMKHGIGLATIILLASACGKSDGTSSITPGQDDNKAGGNWQSPNFALAGTTSFDSAGGRNLSAAAGARPGQTETPGSSGSSSNVSIGSSAGEVGIDPPVDLPSRGDGATGGMSVGGAMPAGASPSRGGAFTAGGTRAANSTGGRSSGGQRSGGASGLTFASGGSSSGGTGRGGQRSGGASGSISTSALGGSAPNSSNTGGANTGVAGRGGTGSGGAARGGTASVGAGGAATAQGIFPKNLVGDATVSISVFGTSREVALYMPSSLPPQAPLLILYHGTGGDPSGFMSDLNVRTLADTAKFVVVGAQAKRPRVGGPCDVDHFEVYSYDTGWNLCDEDPNVNDDVVLTNRMIDEAISAYGVDTRRVYSLGHSNGAFFSFFVAAMLPNRIAAFAEGSGGAMYCANRGALGDQWMGTSTTCAGLKAEPGYPNCTGTLEPARFAPSTRVPPGYILHANNDEIVSIAWSCTLADVLGPANSEVHVRNGGGHALFPEFMSGAWAFLSKQSM